MVTYAIFSLCARYLSKCNRIFIYKLVTPSVVSWGMLHQQQQQQQQQQEQQLSWFHTCNPLILWNAYIIYTHQMTPKVLAGECTNNNNSFWWWLTCLTVHGLVFLLKRRQLVPAQFGEGVHYVDAQKEINILRNKSAISGSVLGPVHVAAHA